MSETATGESTFQPPLNPALYGYAVLQLLGSELPHPSQCTANSVNSTGGKTRFSTVTGPINLPNSWDDNEED